MANPDILNQAERLKIINQIIGQENVSRKKAEQRKFDIYRNRQAQYVLERLEQEFNPDTVKRMRKVLSINPCKRIVDQLGSIYIKEPERSFSRPGESDLSEDQEQQLEEFYHCNAVDPNMRLANRYYKLHDQAALYVVPKLGRIVPRALTPKDYDVVPDADDPEQAFCYILNVFDINLYGPQTKDPADRGYSTNSKVAQEVANNSDRDRLLMRFVWWTKDVHFTTNGHGEYVPEGPLVENPIKRLPFIDIAIEKDFQFFVRRGNNIAEFVIDLLVQICDLAEISRLQGYSQAIIYSIEQPQNLVVGPNKCMWIKQPASGEQSQPKFAFETPAPDLANALEIVNMQLKMFLSSHGLDASVVSGDTPKRAFTSGIDHLLANIDKFQASQEDIDLFRRVETELFDVMRLWSNAFQAVTGDGELVPDLKIGQLPDDISIEVCFSEPQVVQTQKEIEDSVIKRWDNNLLTTKDAVKELYEFDDDKAEKYLEELAADRAANPRPAIPGLGQPGTETPPKAQPGQPGANGAGKPLANGKAQDMSANSKMPSAGGAVENDVQDVQ